MNSTCAFLSIKFGETRLHVVCGQEDGLISIVLHKRRTWWFQDFPRRGAGANGDNATYNKKKGMGGGSFCHFV